MTPPLPAGPVVGTSKPFAPADIGGVSDVSPNPQAPISGLPVKPADSYIPMDDGAGGDYKSVQDLLNAIGDRQLFGDLGFTKYDPERNKKYLEVTMAILEIRKYLRGDEKNYAEATSRIEKWLTNPELLSDLSVAHQARVNLIKALKRAPKGQGLDVGVKAILEALNKNYSSKAPAKPDAPKAEEKPKVEEKSPAAGNLKDELSDTKLFGDHYSAYNAERNKKYLRVSMALIEIRKFAKGESTSASGAKSEIAKWLGDATLLTDPVAHAARLSLLKILGPYSKGSDSFSKGIAGVIDALKADYSKAGDAPKKSDPKPEPDTKAKSGSKGLTELSVNPKSQTKDKRTDDAKSLASGLQGAIRPALGRLLKKYDSLKIKSQMTISVDETTGQVVTVSFKDIDPGPNISQQDLRDLLVAVANNIRARFRFKPMGESGLSFFKVPLTIVGQ